MKHMKSNQKTTLKENKKGFANLVPMVLAVIITFAIIFIGGFVNGTINEELRTASGNADALNTMNNITANWDSSLDIVQVVIIITVLAAAIGAIFLFTRFRG